MIAEAGIVLVEETEVAKELTPVVAADRPTEMAPIIVMEQLRRRALIPINTGEPGMHFNYDGSVRIKTLRRIHIE